MFSIQADANRIYTRESRNIQRGQMLNYGVRSCVWVTESDKSFLFSPFLWRAHNGKMVPHCFCTHRQFLQFSWCCISWRTASWSCSPPPFVASCIPPGISCSFLEPLAALHFALQSRKTASSPICRDLVWFGQSWRVLLLPTFRSVPDLFFSEPFRVAAMARYSTYSVSVSVCSEMNVFFFWAPNLRCYLFLRFAAAVVSINISDHDL